MEPVPIPIEFAMEFQRGGALSATWRLHILYVAEDHIISEGPSGVYIIFVLCAGAIPRAACAFHGFGLSMPSESSPRALMVDLLVSMNLKRKL